MVFVTETYNVDTKDRLTAVVENGSIRFLIWGHNDRVLRYDELTPSDFDQFIGSDHGLRSIHVHFASPTFHLIPNDLYERGRDAVYLANIRPEQTNEMAHSLHIDFLDISGSYYVPFDLVSRLKNHIPEVSFDHFIEMYLGLIRPQLFDTKFKGMMLHVFRESVLIVFLEGGRFQFANQFTFKTTEDVLYYVLAIYDRFGQDPGDVPMTLSGDIDRESALYERLYEYVRHIDFLKTNRDIAFKDMPFDLKTHQVIALL